MQSLTAVSSTEAEFYTAYKAGKILRFPCMVIKQPGYEQTEPTILHIDNISALKMINENTALTKQCRYVKICYWMLQDWVRTNKVLLMRHLPGALNISDY